MRRRLVTSLLVTFAVVLAACSSGADPRAIRADSATAPGDTTPGDNGGPTTGPPTPSDVSLDWGKCNDPEARDAVLQCATLAVPLDYSDPAGGTIDLALVRVPANAKREGAVLLNPGGPGGSGFDPVAQSGTTIASELGLDHFDLIGFDPRGVDRSNGLRCESDKFRDEHLYLDPSPDTPEEQALLDEAEAAFVDGCKKAYGDTLRHYSTANTARDMDTIRAALGDDQITFLGISYGTYLGATYATLFPDRVRAMVLDSAFEPNGDNVEQQYETQLVGFEHAFDNWAAWCEADSSCPFNAPDVGARWDALLAKLDATPVAAADGRLGNNAVMARATTAALYSEIDWPVLAAALADAERGDVAGIFALADEYNGRKPDGTFNTLYQSFTIIQCASGIESQPPSDPEALAATLRAKAPRFGKDITADDFIRDSGECSDLVGDVQPVQLHYEGDGPIVVVGGTNDPATPIRWAQEMVAELGPNAVLVTSTGEGHGQLLTNTCVTDIEAALLADRTLPDPGTVCDPDPVAPRPDWWDELPTPVGVSPVVSLPAVNAALGVSDTFGYSEVHTTSLGSKAATSAYSKALQAAGFDLLGTASIDIADTVNTGFQAPNGDTLVLLVLGPGAFDDEAMASAKGVVPAGTTVVMLLHIAG